MSDTKDFLNTVECRSRGTERIYSRDLDDRRLLKSNLLPLLKWVSILLAIFACLQITRVITALDGTAKTETETAFPDLYEASVLELQAGLDAGHFSSVDLVKVLNVFIVDSLYLNPYQTYFMRIEEVNLQGPELRAVLELNPSALKQAAALDKERKLTGKRSHLHGIPVLLKVGLFINNSPLI
jgi:amidase